MYFQLFCATFAVVFPARACMPETLVSQMPLSSSHCYSCVGIAPVVLRQNRFDACPRTLLLMRRSLRFLRFSRL